MSPLTRILKDNRRERGGRGVPASEYLLRFAIALLTLFSVFRKQREIPKAKERLSVTQERLYREWARGEAEG